MDLYKNKCVYKLVTVYIAKAYLSITKKKINDTDSTNMFQSTLANFLALSVHISLVRGQRERSFFTFWKFMLCGY